MASPGWRLLARDEPSQALGIFKSEASGMILVVMLWPEGEVEFYLSPWYELGTGSAYFEAGAQMVVSLIKNF